MNISGTLSNNDNAPVGTIYMYYGTSSPCDCTYLVLDGSTFS
jgi:hypothetical protein